MTQLVVFTDRVFIENIATGVEAVLCMWFKLQKITRFSEVNCIHRQSL